MGRMMEYTTKEIYKFRKVNGVWQRRRSVRGPWESLTSERIAQPDSPPVDADGKRTHITQPETTVWSWK
jgi:hypothetical protein